MEAHSTNYYDTFIEVAQDTKAVRGTEPSRKGDKMTIAALQYALLAENPYRYTSDDVIFQVHAIRNQLPQGELARAREEFFQKGQPCLRTSPLAKTHGFGLHHDAQGRIALYGMETAAYKDFVGDPKIVKRWAMKSKR